MLIHELKLAGLFLNHLRSVPKVKNAIIAELRNLYEGLDDFDVRIKGGTVEVFLTEGDFVIPASRLSDGTLRLPLLAGHPVQSRSAAELCAHKANSE